jgi:hypothetical protein
MAGGSEVDGWWKNIQEGDVLELFVMGDVVQESETRRKSKKGRDDKQSEGWRPCTVLSVEGTGQRAKAVVSFTDLSGNKSQETIAVRDSGGGRLRQCARAEDENERTKGKKSKKAAVDEADSNETWAKTPSKQNESEDIPDVSSASIVGMRVKVLYDEDEWYEGVIRNPTKKAGEYCIIFEDDEETTAIIPSPEGDVELILTKDELCEKAKQSVAMDGLIYRAVHTCLVRSRSVKSSQEIPAPYVQLMSTAVTSVVRRIRWSHCPRFDLLLA